MLLKKLLFLDSRPSFPKKTASRIRGRHDDSMDSPMVRNTQAKTSEDYLDTPVSNKVVSNPIDSSHGDSPMLLSVQKRRNRLISSSDEESADEKDRSPPSSNPNNDEKSSSKHNHDNEERPQCIKTKANFEEEQKKNGLMVDLNNNSVNYL